MPPELGTPHVHPTHPTHALRLGLISDTHIPEARDALWPQVFEAFRGVDAILHAGDIHDLSVIDALHAVAPTYAARGNGDDGSGSRVLQPDHPQLRPAWLLEFQGVRIGVIHAVPLPEHEYVAAPVEPVLLRMFGRTDLDVLVFGDSHVEAIFDLRGMLCVNPGSPTLPRQRLTTLGTIGFLDIVDGRASASLWQLTEDSIVPHAG